MAFNKTCHCCLTFHADFVRASSHVHLCSKEQLTFTGVLFIYISAKYRLVIPGRRRRGGGGRGAVRSPTEQVAMGAVYMYTIEIVPPYAFLVNLVPDLALIDLESGKEIITPFVRPRPY